LLERSNWRCSIEAIFDGRRRDALNQISRREWSGDCDALLGLLAGEWISVAVVLNIAWQKNTENEMLDYWLKPTQHALPR
jgi:hypothetical protein